MPAGTAITVFLLAKNTGWTIDYILWELPVALLEQYRHFEYWQKDVKAKFCSRINLDEIRKIEEIIGI